MSYLIVGQETKESSARAASTYRAARRNAWRSDIRKWQTGPYFAIKRNVHRWMMDMINKVPTRVFRLTTRIQVVHASLRAVEKRA